MATLKPIHTQRVILAAAGARDSGLVLPLPKSLRVNRGIQTIVLRGLLTKDLIATRPALPDEEVWETSEDGSRTALVITAAGLEAIGIVPASDSGVETAPATKPRPKGKDSVRSGVTRESQRKRASASEEASQERRHDR